MGKDFRDFVEPGRSPLTLFLLVFVLAIPFLVIGAVTGFQLLPGLPVEISQVAHDE